jgi:hypothetical protein
MLNLKRLICRPPASSGIADCRRTSRARGITEVDESLRDSRVGALASNETSSCSAAVFSVRPAISFDNDDLQLVMWRPAPSKPFAGAG